MDDQGYKVSSEIFTEKNYAISKKPTVDNQNVVSKFNFILPEQTLRSSEDLMVSTVTVDADGDLNVPRKKSRTSTAQYIEIEHKSSTILDLVGLQVWRGALLLADWMIYNYKNIPEGSIILELGSGVGFTSIITSMFFPVICTDIDKGNILKVIESNVKRNKHLVRHPVKVLELDFISNEIPRDIMEHLPNIPVIIAADTIYDDSITDAFIKTICRFLQNSSDNTSIFVALEKRYVFTISDCDTTAPCFDYFLESLKKLTDVKYEEVPLTFPKYFEYDRVKELVLWKVTSS
ncbi:methyltransferase-like protein 22 isoform X2 [Diorhabda sublineata]|uniref:methyltransferase-like protein 22 isoform X2 n=1 Tax=Diorhabda sublineata TaxID=1163346 RepID=UPI0024E14F8B|nr:methyltransferase-like protein 22 isoform X2 [Diorhabda sublineata]XP_056637538.1 methyltransferase-like protein 22 isoform X2 [Diorhabda sublineata]